MISTRRPLLLGHRGARVPQVPENTQAAFDLALRAGCDGFEFDVRSTLDQQLVILHDPRLCGLEVSGSTYAELQQRWEGQIIPRLPLTQRRSLNQEQLALPCLQDVIHRYGGRAFLDIELKVLGLEAAVLRVLEAHPPQNGFVISSFQREVLDNLREKDDQVPLGLICESGRQLSLWPKLPLSFVIPHFKLISQELIADLRGAG
ncbi:MAG TPA: glycerophosphodiester phosphodiesterase, partial [Terriglobales bacterium]|nr:glycerophosphodiester phosphodiesterase [Terriglobales bacterium]